MKNKKFIFSIILASFLCLVLVGCKKHTHTYSEWTITTPATCTEVGAKERACSCGEKETAIIPMIEHDYVEVDKVESTCTVKGTEKHFECSSCHQLFQKVDETYVLKTADDLKLELKEHTYTTWSTSKVTDVTQLTENDTIVFVSSTKGCKSDSTSFDVTLNETVLQPNQDFEVFTLVKGTTDGTWSFKNSDGKYVGAYKQDSKTLGTGNTDKSAKTSYTITLDDNFNAKITCTSTANDSVAKYIVYSTTDNQFERVTTEDANIIIYKYCTTDFVPAKDETCTENGNTAYYKCHGCGKYLFDTNGNHIENANSVVISKTGHDLEHSWEWAEDHSYARITITCKNENDAKLVDRKKVTAEKVNTATCTQAGTITYSVSYTYLDNTYTDSYSEEIAAGHKYYLEIADRYNEVGANDTYDSTLTYYTYSQDTEEYTAATLSDGFVAGTTYYTFEEAHKEYTCMHNDAEVCGCKLVKVGNAYNFAYTCLECFETNTVENVTIKSVSEAKALTEDDIDDTLFLVKGIVLGAVHNGSRSALLIQDESNDTVFEVSDFATGLIYGPTEADATKSELKNGTFKTGDLVLFPVKLYQLVKDGEFDHHKLSLMVMTSFCNVEPSSCVLESGKTVKALNEAEAVEEITSQDDLTSFIYTVSGEGEEKTYTFNLNNFYKPVKLSGLITLYNSSGNVNIAMGNTLANTYTQYKINGKTIRFRAGNEEMLVGENVASLIFDQAFPSSNKALFTGDIYGFFYGGSTDYLIFVVISEDDVVSRQIVNPNATITFSDPTKTLYKVNQDYSIAGAKATVTYYSSYVKNFVNTKEVALESSNVVAAKTTYNKSTAGTYKVVVSYNEVEHEYEFKVLDKELTAITAPAVDSGKTYTTVYYTDLTVNGLIKTNITIGLKYDNDSTGTANLSDCTIALKENFTLVDGEGVNDDTTHNNVLVISYQGKTVEWKVKLVYNKYFEKVTTTTLTDGDYIIVSSEGYVLSIDATLEAPNKFKSISTASFIDSTTGDHKYVVYSNNFVLMTKVSAYVGEEGYSFKISAYNNNYISRSTSSPYGIIFKTSDSLSTGSDAVKNAAVFKITIESNIMKLTLNGRTLIYSGSTGFTTQTAATEYKDSKIVTLYQLKQHVTE